MCATLNGSKMQVASGIQVQDGTVVVGYSNRVESGKILPVVADIVSQGAIFRNASGALSLAYVAAGRLLGYFEEHMNAWDCLAGQLMIAEAGGVVETQNAIDMIQDGGRVVVGTPEIFEKLKELLRRRLEGVAVIPREEAQDLFSGNLMRISVPGCSG